MPSKKVTIVPKPQERIADDWVNGVNANPVREDRRPSGAPATASPTQTIEATPEDTGEAIPLKRLTIDIPETLHTRIKTQCAQRRTKMVDEIRVLLENHFPE